MPVAKLLDEIWRYSGDQRRMARELVDRATDRDLLEIAFCILDSSFKGWLTADWESHDTLALTLKGNGQVGRASVGRVVDDLTIMRFSDYPATIEVDNSVFKAGWGDVRIYSAADLLLAMQFARDHSDSMLVLPSDRRQDVWRETSHELGVPEALLKELSAEFTGSVRRIPDRR